MSRRVSACGGLRGACAPRVGLGSVQVVRAARARYAAANIRTVTTVGSLNKNSNNSRLDQQLNNVKDFGEH